MDALSRWVTRHRTTVGLLWLAITVVTNALVPQLEVVGKEHSVSLSPQDAPAMIAMKKLGSRFALDDFGTGFSSFTHLRHLPVDLVKIEGSFVEGMVGSDMDRKMVASIAQLAHSFGLKVVGEHVNSFETLAALRACGADFAQGHYLGEPRQLVDIDFSELFVRQETALPKTAA